MIKVIEISHVLSLSQDTKSPDLGSDRLLTIISFVVLFSLKQNQILVAMLYVLIISKISTLGE